MVTVTLEEMYRLDRRVGAVLKHLDGSRPDVMRLWREYRRMFYLVNRMVASESAHLPLERQANLDMGQELDALSQKALGEVLVWFTEEVSLLLRMPLIHSNSRQKSPR